MNKRHFFKMSILGIGALSFSKKLKALEYYPMQSDKKWAVIYSTWCGSSRDAAVWISEGMNGIANVFDVRENPDLSEYEHVVVGGSIRGGEVSEEMQTYLTKNENLLKNKVRGLFAICGNRMQTPGEQQTTDLIDNHLASLCGVSGVASKVFLGRITYGLLDEASRESIEGLNQPEYDNLKRTDCLEFGKSVLTNS